MITNIMEPLLLFSLFITHLAVGGELLQYSTGVVYIGCPLMKGGATTTKERSSNPVTEEDILKNIVGLIPMSTRKTTEWSVKTW